MSAAVDRARRAFDVWGGLPYAERREHILAVRDVMLDRLDEIVDTITSETGKLGSEAVFTEIMTACETIAYYARHGERALRPRRVDDRAHGPQAGRAAATSRSAWSGSSARGTTRSSWP